MACRTAPAVRTRGCGRALCYNPPVMARYLFETEEHVALREQVRRFAVREMAPHALAWEDAGEIPRALYKAAADAGVLGIGYDEALGGAGGDMTHALVAAEELLVASKSVGGVVSLLGSLGIAIPPIIKLGTPEQRERFAGPALRGEKIAALGITESGTGSDVAAVGTRAERHGDHYVVNGSKTFITSGTRADFVTAAVRTGADGHGGLSLLVIEADTPGFRVAGRLDKMGWRASDTAELVFEDCHVPVSNLVGVENQGFIAIMMNFVHERLSLAAQAIAIGELAYREAVAYAQQRRAFGSTLSGFQVTRHKLADMAVRIAAARALTGEVAVRDQRGEKVAPLAAMAKNAATDACSWVVDQAVQIHGGYGYMREYVVERLYRDARLYPIGGGTREIMNEIISKAEGY